MALCRVSHTCPRICPLRRRHRISINWSPPQKMHDRRLAELITAHMAMASASTCSFLYFLVSFERPNSASIHPSVRPSNQQTQYSLTHSTPLHSTLLDLRAHAARQERELIGISVLSVCLSCCPPTMIDSLPRSSAIQRRTVDRTIQRTTVSAQYFWRLYQSLHQHQTWAAIPGSEAITWSDT